MKIIAGTANLNPSPSAAKTRATSERLTKALAKNLEQEEAREPDPPSKPALLSTRSKAPKISPKAAVRRDLLAEAKAAAAIQSWKAR